MEVLPAGSQNSLEEQHEQQQVILGLLHGQQPNSSPTNAEHQSSMSYGSLGRMADDFLPLSGGEFDVPWAESEQYPSEDTAETRDPNRPSANTLIYLCALCSSLTSVLLGYGKLMKLTRLLTVSCIRW